VKRPFAHEFWELYFFNPKAEEFKWWTAIFLSTQFSTEYTGNSQQPTYLCRNYLLINGWVSGEFTKLFPRIGNLYSTYIVISI
jgi:hypothetical protein